MTSTPEPKSAAERALDELAAPGADQGVLGVIHRVLMASVLALVGLSVGCGFIRETVVPQHKWSDEWGPMVPHTTFPEDCSLCHLPDRWDAIKDDFEFDHHSETGYPLKGAHEGAACLRCHNDRGPVQMYLARGCAGCHPDPHKSALGLDCTECHDEVSWYPRGLIAEHHRTRFPLVGAHAITACESCHVRAPVGDYRGSPVDCHLCHQQEASVAAFNHVVNGWVRDCEECHGPSDWQPVNFRHDLFPLDGAHLQTDCTMCHTGGRVAGTPNDCFSCHRNDYTQAPNHVAGGLSTNCLNCHTTFDWVPR